MNCGTFVINRLLARAASEGANQAARVLEGRRSLQCARCGLLVTALTLSEKGYHCPGCTSVICVMCGCTEERTCRDGCYWIAMGICSSCAAELASTIEEAFGTAGER